MKRIMRYRILTGAMLIVIAMVLNSCGGGGYGGGGGMAVSGAGVFSITSPPSPADGAMGVGTTPTFAWTPSAGATDYRVQVDTSATFGTLVINAMVNSTTYSYTVPASMLTLGTLYHWRIIAENIYGQAVAGPRTFTP
jgi:hypothetical protein